MKRIFKRYPEINYTDWLDKVILELCDEIWYEKKINLSTGELYLVVKKYPRIEEKLKAIYNKLNINDSISLTEDNVMEYSAEITTEVKIPEIVENLMKISTNSALTDKETNSALTDKETNSALTDKEKAYWLNVKRIVEKKYRRKSDSSDSDWSSRLLNNFIKTYCAENAIFDSLKQKEDILIEYGNTANDKKSARLIIKKGNDTIAFTDGARDNLYLSNYELGEADKKSKVAPDIKCIVDLVINGVTIRSNIELTLECKSIRGSKGSSIHGANIVVYYDVDYTNQGVTGHFYLEPQQSFASKIFKRRDKIKANEITLFIDGFRNATCENSTIQNKLKLDFDSLKKNLDYVAVQLDGSQADSLSNERISTLSGVTTQIASLLPTKPDLNLASTDLTPNKAARKLEQTTDTLVKTILNTENSRVLTTIADDAAKANIAITNTKND
jgi:hypothetical protein